MLSEHQVMDTCVPPFPTLIGCCLAAVDLGITGAPIQPPGTCRLSETSMVLLEAAQRLGGAIPKPNLSSLPLQLPSFPLFQLGVLHVPPFLLGKSKSQSSAVLKARETHCLEHGRRKLFCRDQIWAAEYLGSKLSQGVSSPVCSPAPCSPVLKEQPPPSKG